MPPKIVTKVEKTSRPRRQSKRNQENGLKEPDVNKETVDALPSESQALEQQEPRKKRRTQPDASQQLVPVRHTEAGEIYVCGQGDFGQLGLGNLLEGGEEDAEIVSPRHSPILAGKGIKVRQVAAGGMHSVALTMDGRVFTTGVNDEAALGRQTDAEVWNKSSRPGKAEDSHCWGQVAVPFSHGRIIEVTAGDSHTAALAETGAVWAWGCFRGSSGPFAFSQGVKFALHPELAYTPASVKEQVLTISSGADHILALRRDGSVLSWGFGEQGQLGRLGTRTTFPERAMLQPNLVPLHRIQGDSSRKKFEAVAIAAAAYGSFIVSSTGKAAAFGVNASGQLGLEVAGATVEANIIQRPTLVASLSDHQIKLLEAGKAHSLALTQQGSLLSFGLQTYGRLGRTAANPNSDAPLAPGQVDGVEDVDIASIVAGPDTSAIVTSDGGAFLWGMGSTYQLAKKNDEDELVPKKLNLQRTGIKKVLQVSYGGQHTLILAQSE